MSEVPLFKPSMGAAEAEAAARTVGSGWIGPGEKVVEFEKRLAKWLDWPYCVVVNSGTSALMLAMLDAGVKPGTFVLVPAYGHPAAANVAQALGARLQYSEVYAGGASHLRTAEIERGDVVVWLRHNGLATTCGARDKPVVIDACAGYPLFHGPLSSEYKQPYLCLSFSPQKPISTGQGGAVLVRNEAMAERLRGYRNRGNARGPGFNLRMPDILAAVGLEQMNSVGRRLAEKEATLKRYREESGGVIEAPPGAWLAWIEVDATKRTDCIEFLEQRGVGAHGLYKAISDRHYAGAQTFAAKAVYLPTWPGMTSGQVSQVLGAVKAWGKRSR